MNPITMDKKYVTRTGKKVRVLCIDAPDGNEYPVIALIEGSSEPYSFTSIGTYWAAQASHDHDLLECAPTVVRYASVYSDAEIGLPRETPDEAQPTARLCKTGLGIVKITITNKVPTFEFTPK